MRLRQYKELFQNILDTFEIIISNEKNVKSIENRDQALKDMAEFEKIPILKKTMNKYESLNTVYQLLGNSYSLSGPQTVILHNFQKHMENFADDMLYILKDIIQDDDSLSVSIKLPEINTLGSMVKNINDLISSIETVLIHDKLDGRVELTGVDSGSMWIEISVGSLSALSGLCAIVGAAVKIRKSYIEGNLLNEKIRGLKIDNDAKQQVLSATSDQLDNEVTLETQAVLKEISIIDDNEFQSRVKHAIITLSKFFERGGEIHCSQLAPEEIKDCFPKYSELKRIDLFQKQLSSSEKTNDKDAEEGE